MGLQREMQFRHGALESVFCVSEHNPLALLGVSRGQTALQACIQCLRRRYLCRENCIDLVLLMVSRAPDGRDRRPRRVFASYHVNV